MQRSPGSSSRPKADRTVNPSNVVVLRGRISSAPRHRTLPSGTVLVQLEVTTPSVGTTADTAASVPVAWFDPRRSRIPDEGDEVVVVGHARRRFFRAGGVTASRTEVVASQVIDARRRAQVERALEQAAEALR